MKQTANYRKRAALTGSTVALAVLASLSFSTSSFAKKGGGGKPGGDDPPPPPEPAPVSYVLTWVDSDTDASRFWDIDANGVAVGHVHPGGVSADKYGTVCFPDRTELIDLEALASTHPDYPAGWRLTTAFRISDNLLISGVLRSPAGGYHTFAAQLIDNGPTTAPTIAWFRYFRASDFGASDDAAYLHDASEAGELIVHSSEGGFLWDPVNDATVGPLAAWFFVNNQRQVCNRTLLVDVNAGTQSALPSGGDAWDISDNGTVVGVIERTKGRGSETMGRVVNGSWQAIGPTTSGFWKTGAIFVNGAEQVLGFTDLNLSIYSDQEGVGFRLVDDLLTGAASDLSLWNSAEPFEFLDFGSTALGDADASGFGHICGSRIVNGLYRGFILTPQLNP